MEKILIVNTSGLGVGGIATHMVNYLSELRFAKVHFDVISTIEEDANIVSRLEDAGCTILHLPNRKRNPLGYMVALFWLLKRGNYDVVQVHGSSSIMSIELFLAKMAGIKKRIAHSHNTTCSHVIANRILAPIFHSSYTHALACSQVAGEWLFGKREFTVLHNAFDYRRFKFDDVVRTEYRHMLHIMDDQLLIIQVGNLGEQKNPLFMIDVIRLLAQKRPCKILYVGDGIYANDLRNKIEAEHLASSIELLGNRNDVDKLLQAADVFVMPSLWEGLPCALLEAQASGIQCLVSDKVTTEAAIDVKTKFLTLDNLLPWVDALVQFSSDNGKRIEHSKQSIQTLDKDYDIKQEAQRLLSFYVN